MLIVHERVVFVFGQMKSVSETDTVSLEAASPPQRVIRKTSHNSQRRYMSRRHTICLTDPAKSQHETHTFQACDIVSVVLTDVLFHYIRDYISSGVCRREGSSLCLKDFRLIAVLGRGHFGKVPITVES